MALTIDQVRSVVEASAINTFQNIKAEIKTHIDELAVNINTIHDNLNGHITTLQEKSAAHDKRLNNIDDRFLRMERLNDILIRNIPATENENASLIFTQICNVIGFTSLTGIQPLVFRIKYSKIDQATSASTENLRKRLRSAKPSSSSAPIIVKFAVSWEKQSFLKAYFTYAKLNLSDIGYQATSRIYIGDYLTKHNLGILVEAIKLRKKQMISSVYTRNGLVFVSKDGGPSKIVQDLTFLKSIA